MGPCIYTDNMQSIFYRIYKSKNKVHALRCLLKAPCTKSRIIMVNNTESQRRSNEETSIGLFIRFKVKREKAQTEH